MTDFPQPSGPLVGLVGDTHRDFRWTSQVIDAMAGSGIDVIVQLGDFGWWPEMGTVRYHADDGFPTPFFPSDVARVARNCGASLLFIDGNHENHEHLAQRHVSALPSADSPLNTPAELYPSLWYLPRGASWEWGGVKFRALGGAFSIDKACRVPGVSWWPEEVPSTADVQAAIDGGPADVLISHDHPDMGYQRPSFVIAESLERSSRQVRRDLRAVVDAIEPSLVVHGHWHQRYSWGDGRLRVEGLDCNGSPGGLGVLDLETLEVSDFRP